VEGPAIGLQALSPSDISLCDMFFSGVSGWVLSL